jgi:hypothetical protein
MNASPTAWRRRRACARPAALALLGAAVVAAAALAAGPAGAAPAAQQGQEFLHLQTTEIKAHEGLPRVLYIGRWKRADAGDLRGRPAASLLDDVVAPVDRVEFRRQLRYGSALAAAAEPKP